MEIILYVVVPKRFVSILNYFVKIIICILFLLLPDHPCVYVYTLHSDEVVSLVVSGCEKLCTL